MLQGKERKEKARKCLSSHAGYGALQIKESQLTKATWCPKQHQRNFALCSVREHAEFNILSRA